MYTLRSVALTLRGKTNEILSLSPYSLVSSYVDHRDSYSMRLLRVLVYTDSACSAHYLKQALNAASMVCIPKGHKDPARRWGSRYLCRLLRLFSTRQNYNSRSLISSIAANIVSVSVIFIELIVTRAFTVMSSHQLQLRRLDKGVVRFNDIRSISFVSRFEYLDSYNGISASVAPAILG